MHANMHIILLAPPTYFPVGLPEFFGAHPDAQIEIYHEDYKELSKFFFAGLIKDRLAEWPQVTIHSEDVPEDWACDLYIEVSLVPPGEESEIEFPPGVWLQSKGSVDLREFINLSPQVQKEFDEAQHRHNEISRLMTQLKENEAAQHDAIVAQMNERMSLREESEEEQMVLREVLQEEKVVLKEGPEEELGLRKEIENAPTPMEKAEELHRARKEEIIREKAAFVDRPKIMNDYNSYTQLNLVGEVVDALINQTELQSETQALFGQKELPQIYEWYKQFCLLNGILDDLVELQRLFHLDEKWPQIKRHLRQGPKTIDPIPFFQTLKVDPDIDDRTHDLIVRTLKEITGTLIGHVEMISPELRKVLKLNSVPEVLDWFQRFCATNNLREDLVSTYYKLAMHMTLPRLLNSLRQK